MRVVWPAIRHLLQEGELKPVEAIASEELQEDLDRLAGIDAWHIVYDRGLMRGIASRVQWLEPDDRVWRSFTIRMQRPNGLRTEFEKRCEAIDRIDEGWLFPHLTVQAYLTEPRRSGRLLAAGIIRTRDLYGFARQRPDRKWLRNPDDGVLFTPWWWKELKAAGLQVGIVDAAESAPIFDETADDYGLDEDAEPTAKVIAVQEPLWTIGGVGDWDDVPTRRPPDDPRAAA